MSKHTGGGKFGMAQHSWPFVTLTINDDGISLRTIFQEVKMKRNFIQGIILQKYFINYRFIFKHNDPVIERELEFWTFFPDPAVNDLKSQGYTILIGKCD